MVAPLQGLSVNNRDTTPNHIGSDSYRRDSMPEVVEEEDPRDPRDKLIPTRPAGQGINKAYTSNPAVDFDGLSWPSECDTLPSSNYS